MTREEVLARVDHTLLKPEARWQDIRTLCDEALKNHTASVCINSCYVRRAAQYLQGRLPVCTVIGFPLRGAMSTAAKVFEARQALADGASEFDMVINIGALKAGEVDAVREEIRAVKAAVGDKVLKVIVETCLLTDAEKALMCDVVCEAGADFIRPAPAFPPGARPLRILRCLRAVSKGAAASKRRAASARWRIWSASLRWGRTVWAPAARSKFLTHRTRAGTIEPLCPSFWAVSLSTKAARTAAALPTTGHGTARHGRSGTLSARFVISF